MVKTKPVVKKSTVKKTSPPMFDGMDEGISKPKANPKNKRGWADQHTEVKPLKKGEYRTKNQPYGGMGEDESRPIDKSKIKTGWDMMMDGQTYRTTDEEKAHIAISRSIKENKGINIQGTPEDSGYAWYMTRIVTKSETEMVPGKRYR